MGIISAKNQAGSYVSLNKKTLIAYADDSLTVHNKAGSNAVLKAGNITAAAPDSIALKAPSIKLDGKVEITGDLKIGVILPGRNPPLRNNNA